MQEANVGHKCTLAPYVCHIPTNITVLYAFLVALLFCYFLGTAALLRHAFCALRLKPYCQMRMGNQILRLQVLSHRRNSTLLLLCVRNSSDSSSCI